MNPTEIKEAFHILERRNALLNLINKSYIEVTEKYGTSKVQISDSASLEFIQSALVNCVNLINARLLELGVTLEGESNAQ